MTYLVERLAELRRHLQHLEEIAPRVTDRTALERDLSLHNDVLFSLLMVAQLVIDIAGELSARRGDRFEDYTEAVRNLARDARFPTALVRTRTRPGVPQRHHSRIRRTGPRPGGRRDGPPRSHRAVCRIVHATIESAG